MRVLATWPNRVTTVRLVGTAILVVLTGNIVIAGPGDAPQLAIGVTGLVCEVLDGVDGWLARRLDQATAFGARYDMEVDSAMVLVLSIALLACGIGGWWVLLLGGWRYGYLIAQRIVPALRRPLPYRYSRKVVAAAVTLTQVGALVLDTIGAPPLLTAAMLATALAALSWSFLRDVVGQLSSGSQT